MPSFSAAIFLVDDDVAILRITSQVLEKGFQLTCIPATTGTEALDLMAREPVGLVLSDLGLPDIPGEELLSRLRRDHPEVPIIIVTALADIDSAVRCMGNGAHDYVVKGSDPKASRT